MPWRDRFGSDCGGPVLRQRRDKETTKEDKRTGDRQGAGAGGGRGNYGGGERPSRRTH